MKPSNNDESSGAHSDHSSQNKVIRFLKWITPIAVVTGLLYLAIAPKPVQVDLGEVVRGPMEITIDDEGETRVRERYLISSPLTGRVLRMNLEPGDILQKGDRIATIIPEASSLLDPRARAQAKALVSAAEAALTHAEEQVELAIVDVETSEKSHRRNTELHAVDGVTDVALEASERIFLTARHTLHAAESGVELAWFELEQAKAALLHAERDTPEPPLTDDQRAEDDEAWSLIIESPIDGQVLRVPEKSSRPLQAGTLLLEIGNPEDLEIAIEVLSQDAVKIMPGQPIRIEHWGGQMPIFGQVRHIEPSAFTKISALGVDEQRVKVLADFEPPPRDKHQAELGDGFRVEARIVIWKANNVLQVPTSALFRMGDRWAVFRFGAHDRRAQLTTIEIDHRNPDVAEVISGLTESDRVVLHPGGSITDGTRIEERR